MPILKLKFIKVLKSLALSQEMSLKILPKFIDLKCKTLRKKMLHFRFVEIDIPFAFGIFVRLTTTCMIGSLRSCIGI